MDLSVLPDVLLLTVLIAGFRPLVRRAGAHVDLWFLAWGFLLLHSAALLFAPLPGFAGVFAALIALWATQLCALCFVAAAANTPNTAKPRVGPALLLEMSVPVLLQAGMSILYPGRDLLQHVCCLLFLLPALHQLVHPEGRGRAIKALSLSFGLFGLAMLPVAGTHPGVVTAGALSLLFFTAAYFYAHAAERVTRGVVAAVTGLACWGLSYPAQALYVHFHPDHLLNPMPGRALLAMPEYVVVLSILLTLLEQHVLRTERMAMHDPLTDLPNRRLFEERLVHTMAEASAQRTTVACLVIDVDNFKLINDTLGHTAGDQLLRALAVRLSWHMSPRDILARTGGDEFTALLAGVRDEHHLRFIASAMMSAAGVPVEIDGQSVDVRISVGIALSPDHADGIEDLRRLADEAMYSAKRRGGSLLAFAGEE